MLFEQANVELGLFITYHATNPRNDQWIVTCQLFQLMQKLVEVVFELFPVLLFFSQHIMIDSDAPAVVKDVERNIQIADGFSRAVETGECPTGVKDRSWFKNLLKILVEVGVEAHH